MQEVPDVRVFLSNIGGPSITFDNYGMTVEGFSAGGKAWASIRVPELDLLELAALIVERYGKAA